MATATSAPKTNKIQVKHESVVAQAVMNDNDQEAEEFVILSGKYIVETVFLEAVESQFIDIYPALLEEVDYTPEELVGEMFWADLNDVERRLAILCLKHLATEPDVPLCDVTCDCCGITSFEIV